MTESNNKSQKLDLYAISQEELAHLLNDRLDFRETCNLISLLEKYPRTFFFCQQFLQHRLRVAMSLGDYQPTRKDNWVKE